MQPSRQFKENVVVGGCFTLSLITFLVVLAAFQLWYFLPVLVIGWAFVLWQSVRLGVWKKRSAADEKNEPREKD